MVSPVIKTEGKYFAKFTEIDRQVDEAYFLSYDSLATINSFIYVITAFIMGLIGFAFVYYNNRIESTVSLADTLFTSPLILVAAVSIIFVIYIIASWRNQNTNLFTRALPFIFFLIAAGLTVVWFLNKKEEKGTDTWNIPKPSLLEGDKNISISTYILTVLVSVGFITTWINSKMRTDRLNLLAPAYWSFAIFSLLLSIASVYVVGIFNKIIKQSDGAISNEPWVYLLMALGLFLILLMFDGIANSIANIISGTNSKIPTIAATPELANATYRSRQMITLSLAIVVFLPVFLSMLFKDGMVTGSESWKSKDGLILLGGVILLFPVLTVIGLVSLELQQKANVVYMGISNIMIAVAFAILALMVIPFNFETVISLVVILTGITLQYLLGYEMGSRLIIAIIIGFIFMLVKFTGKTILESIGSNASDMERLVYLGLPMILFTGIWFVRSYILNRSFEAPLTLLVFTLGYIWLYFDTASATNKDYILTGKDSWSNIGVDWVIVTSIIMLITTISGFGYEEVDYFQYLSGRELPVVGTFVKIIFGIAAGYAGSVLYNKVLTDEIFISWISSLQEFANKNLDLLKKDLTLK
jgi:hypothetical protein